MGDSEFIRIVDDCIDAMRDGATLEDCLAAYPEHREELHELLSSIVAFREAAQQVAPSDDFVARSPARLQRRLSQQLTNEPPSAPLRFPKRLLRFAGAVAASLIIALAGAGGVAFAADDAVPGDPLYAVDRSVERIRLERTLNPQRRLALEVEFAAERLEEAEALFGAGEGLRAQAVIEEYEQTVTAIVGDLPTEPPAVVTDALDRQQRTLERLLAGAPEAAQPTIERALEASTVDEPPVEDVIIPEEPPTLTPTVRSPKTPEPSPTVPLPPVPTEEPPGPPNEPPGPPDNPPGDGGGGNGRGNAP